MLRSAESQLSNLLDVIRVNNPIHGKYLSAFQDWITPSENEDFERLLEFYRMQGKTIEALAEAYLMFLNDTMEETKYFIEHDAYRYHKFSEVAEFVYFDKQYMEKYMIGLSLSLYLWPQHRECGSFFEEAYKKYISLGSHYLEIGPGHGIYFCNAVKTGKCESYTAVDLSETSLKMTRDVLQYFFTENEMKRCAFLCEDITRIDHVQEYDFIVMCEVLEHVEQPLPLLRALRKNLAIGGHAFISVPINAPEKDHIFLFRSIEEVEDLIEQAGFNIQDKKAFCTKGQTLQRAIKRKEPIITAFVLA